MVKLSFDEYVEKVRNQEMYIHAHLLTIDTIENHGRDYDWLVAKHRDMMSKINDDVYMFNAYIKYCKS